MATNSKNKPLSFCRVYAKALFEIAEEKNILDKVQQDLEAFLETLTVEPALPLAFANTAFSNSAKTELSKKLAEKLSLSKEVIRFIELLIQKNRINFFSEICRAFSEIKDVRQNILRGTVTTVGKLDETTKQDLAQAFAKRFNKKVILEQKENKAILGGLVVELNGLVFDGSLKTTLNNLKENLERQSV